MDIDFNLFRNGRLDMKRITKLLLVILVVTFLLVIQIVFDGRPHDRLQFRKARNNCSDIETATDHSDLNLRNSHSLSSQLVRARVASNLTGAVTPRIQQLRITLHRQHDASKVQNEQFEKTRAKHGDLRPGDYSPTPTQNATLHLERKRDSLVVSTHNKTLEPKKGNTSLLPAQQPQGLKQRNGFEAESRVLPPKQLLQIVGNVIASYPLVPSNKVVRILVVTYFRAGSTFIGDILQQNWKTFYHFEPLHYMSSGVRIKNEEVPEALNLLENIFRCQFSSPISKHYLQWASKERNTFLFKRNHFLWVACRVQPPICFRDDFVEFVCRRAPVQVMKVNRLNMVDVQRFVAANPDLDIRVVHLVRDPRGTVSSRKVLDWCNTTSCSDFRVLCSEMENDARIFDELRQSNPRRYFQLRYEDLSVHSLQMTRQLYTALDLPFTISIRRFLKISTSRARDVDEHDPYSTRRNSSQAAFAWKKKLKPSDVARIQKGCANVLRRYRYDLYVPPPTARNTTDTH